MPLTDMQCKNTKPSEDGRARRIYDEKGLYLEITAKGAKYFRFKYRIGGKEKVLALGVYPDVSLADARAMRDEARKQVKQGIDPAELRKVKKASTAAATENGFERVALEWLTKNKPRWSEDYHGKLLAGLTHNVFPWIGGRPIGEIEAPELLAVLRRIEGRGANETAHRVRGTCQLIFGYAIATGKATRNPAADLQKALAPAVKSSFATITDPVKIGELLRAIDGYAGTLVCRCALKLAPIVFVRPGELRAAEWSEFNLSAKLWEIPAEKMKMGEKHYVPLSRQAIAVLEELRPLTGGGKYVFPSERTITRPMSENTVNAALRRMGYGKDEMTGHGFRHMASTLLNELGYNRDAIERQLAHGERNNVRATYNYAQYMPERTRMMQEWADYLDRLKSGAEVIPFSAGSKP